MPDPHHPYVSRRAKLKDSNPPITGTITEVTCAHTPSPESAFNIYTIAVDPECYDLPPELAGHPELSETWTSWNTQLLQASSSALYLFSNIK